MADGGNGKSSSSKSSTSKSTNFSLGGAAPTPGQQVPDQALQSLQQVRRPPPRPPPAERHTFKADALAYCPPGTLVLPASQRQAVARGHKTAELTMAPKQEPRGVFHPARIYIHTGLDPVARS